jgi:hypothetical protein
VAAIDVNTPTEHDAPYEDDVMDVAAEMRAVGSQFQQHPGYDSFPPHSSAIDFDFSVSPCDLVPLVSTLTIHPSVPADDASLSAPTVH